MIEPARSTRVSPPGSIVYPRAGDFILTHQDHLSAKLIRFGQNLRFRGELHKYAQWNHAAFVINDSGGLVEALVKGVTRSHISKYKEKEYTIVRVNATAADVDQMVKFAEWTVGQSYGFLTIASLGLWTIFGGRVNMALDGTEICSALVARCLERAGYIFSRDPSRVTPADLARHFQVK